MGGISLTTNSARSPPSYSTFPTSLTKELSPPLRPSRRAALKIVFICLSQSSQQQNERALSRKQHRQRSNNQHETTNHKGANQRCQQSCHCIAHPCAHTSAAPLALDSRCRGGPPQAPSAPRAQRGASRYSRTAKYREHLGGSTLAGLLFSMGVSLPRGKSPNSLTPYFSFCGFSLRGLAACT